MLSQQGRVRETDRGSGDERDCINKNQLHCIIDTLIILYHHYLVD